MEGTLDELGEFEVCLWHLTHCCVGASVEAVKTSDSAPAPSLGRFGSIFSATVGEM
jgi:hypothetical protein